MLSIDNRKLFSPSLFENLNIKKYPLNKNDLINLYWINGAYLKPEQLKNLINLLYGDCLMFYHLQGGVIILEI